jgi:alkylhydroperoxidase family enzyme
MPAVDALAGTAGETTAASATTHAAAARIADILASCSSRLFAPEPPASCWTDEQGDVWDFDRSRHRVESAYEPGSGSGIIGGVPRQLTTRVEPRADEVADVPPLTIFRTIARNERLLPAFLGLGSHLLRRTTLPAREREIVILRVGWLEQSEYEFGQHTTIGRAAGLTDEEIGWLADVATPSWSVDDAALVAMADELCSDGVVSDGTWSRLTDRWNDEQLLDLLALAGYYRLVSGLLNSAGVALEPQTPRWPEGAVPRLLAPRA